MKNIMVMMYQTSHSKGQELVAQRMVKWFRASGYHSWLITSVFHDGKVVASVDEQGYKIFDQDPVIGLPTIRVKSVKISWPPRRIMLIDLLEILNEIDRELGIDVVITHSTLWNGPEDVAKWVMWRKINRLLGGRTNIPVFAHMSHYQPPDPIRYCTYERAYRIAWNYLLFPVIFRACDLILCTTPLEAEDMLMMGAPPNKIHIFPGGLDDEEAKLIDEAKPDLIIERYKLPKDKKIVTYLGTIEERKNPLAVVKVAARMVHRDDVVFVIAGKPGDQYREVIEMSKRLRNVYVLGELTVEEKVSLIKATYINIILSKMEALGLTQIEFMYGGVPVITSGVYGQKWVVRNGIDGFHVNGPDDIDGAVTALERLLDNEQLRDEMAKNARERGKQFLMSVLMRSLVSRLQKLYSSSMGTDVDIPFHRIDSVSRFS